MKYKSLAVVVATLTLIATDAGACTYDKGPFLKKLEEWRGSCGHPLCGTILVAEPEKQIKSPTPCDAEAWITMKDDIRKTVVAGGAVMFGEVHDNAAQHELRSRVGMSNFASVVMEHVRADQTAALDAYTAIYKNDYKESAVEDFTKLLEWKSSGWASGNYEPLIRAVLVSRRPIFPGDPPRDLIKKVAKEGESALPADEVKRLALDVPFDAAVAASAVAEIEAAHCGALSKEQATTMAVAQRYRDAHIADAALKAISKHGSTIVLAGNEHVRKDRGAPQFITRRAPEKRVVSVQFVEVQAGKDTATDYVPRDAAGKPVVDYVIFTPAAKHADACAGMTPKAAP
ncbi:MAG: ChaN family lipoprotein [Hyphomicrobium sp.]